MPRVPMRDVCSAVVSGILIGTGALNILGAITAASSLTSLGYATLATLDLTLALILYSLVAGKRYDRDR